jgi:colanic acid biosynthesis glycosyl transferase WcaI
LRLTFINQFYTPDLSPTAHLCASLAEHRAAMGDQVTVICGRGGYVKQVEPTQANGVRVIRVWTSQLGSRGLLRRLIDWLTFYVVAMLRAAVLPRQDVIVCLTTPPYIVLAGLIQKWIHPGTRLVLWNMDCYPEAVERTGIIPAGGVIADVLRELNCAIFRRIDRLICLDSAMRELLLSQYQPQDRELPCEIIPNWEQLALFSPGRWPVARDFDELGRVASRPCGASSDSTAAPPADVPSLDVSSTAGTAVPPARVLSQDDPLAESLKGRFVVLYLGNAGYGHEFETLMAAAEQLRDEPISFLFVGGGAVRKWIEQQAKSRGLENFLFHDYVAKEQTPSVMATADCALITLENYAAGVMSPSKLHSNLAMGLPILYIGPCRTNVDEAIERFGCGASLRPGEVDRTVGFLRGLMSDVQERSELSRRARLAFEQAYCDRQTLPNFDTIFSALLSSRDTGL